jgi:hypothetical protein
VRGEESQDARLVSHFCSRQARSWPVARTSSYALSVNDDVVRDTWFLRSSWLRNITGHTRSITGYAAPEVDDLLGRVAAELDAGRPAGPLIENATFRRMHNPLLPGI